MVKKRVIFMLLAVSLVFPVITYSQKSAAAEQSWNAFWTQFAAAVNRKNKASVKRLMASEREFFSGGGGETRDEWLTMIESQKWWGRLQKSVRLGTRSDNFGGKPGRVTKDNHLTFSFIGGRWRFMGLVGD